jgi:hypothetical protein
MPLINKLNDTKLRSLSYGDNKPYITTDVVTGKLDTGKVPLVDAALNLIPNQVKILGKTINIGNTGVISGVKAGIIDASRIGNFLLDLKTGPQFTIKQIALQRSNVVPNGGNSVLFRNPLAGATSFFGKLGRGIFNLVNKIAPYPGQLYSPTNTLVQVALQSGGLHIERAAAFPLLQTPKYEKFFGNAGKTAADTNSNVLRLYEKQPVRANKVLTKFQGIINSIPILNRAIPLPPIGNEVLYSYQGGPESLAGLGITRITRGEIRPGIYTINDSVNSSFSAYTNTWTLNTEAEARTNAIGGKLADGEKDVYIKSSIFTPSVINSKVPFNLFKSSSDNDGATNPSIYNSNISGLKYTNYLGDVVTVKAFNNKVANASREIRIGSGRKDSINLTPIFTGTTSANNSLVKIGNKHYNIRDLIKFRIEVVDNSTNVSTTNVSTFMIFRSYLTNFTDNITSDWNNFKYVGRGENLYTYSGFGRSVTMGFKVAALSEMEMQPMYQKLNYLASSMMPDYTGGYMKGNFFRMTVGNYFYRQIGIITNLSYKISNDTPWEIAIDEPERGTAAERQLYELPHIIDVDLTFIPIGLQNNGDNLIPEKGITSPVILQGDTNPWVNNATIEGGQGVTFANHGSNYVGSDVERSLTAKAIPIPSIQQRQVSISAIPVIDPKKIKPLNLQPRTPSP